jgi:hypothetical protein
VAAVAKWYGHGPAAGAAWGSDTIKVALLDASFTPDQDAQQFFSDVSSHEVSGTGYSAGGVTLANKTSSYDAPTNTATLSADNVAWANASFTTRYAVIYKDTGNPATAPLLGYVDLGASQTVGGSTFTLAWSGSGIFTLNAA